MRAAQPWYGANRPLYLGECATQFVRLHGCHIPPLRRKCLYTVLTNNRTSESDLKVSLSARCRRPDTATILFDWRIPGRLRVRSGNDDIICMASFVSGNVSLFTNSSMQRISFVLSLNHQRLQIVTPMYSTLSVIRECGWDRTETVIIQCPSGHSYPICVAPLL